MRAKDRGVELDPEAWSDRLYREIPELNEIATVSTHPLFFEDSSDLHIEHWQQMARCIERHYSDYDGFVLLHGTDTMAYSASALSFALKNLTKPVIFTGSQVPMSHVRTDALRNLINAIQLATLHIPEVSICFNDALYRGNRSTKLSVGDFDAFGSPNFPPLAEVGIDIEVTQSYSSADTPLLVNDAFDPGIFVITVYPNMNTRILDCLDLTSIRGLIVRAYGSGNFPIKGAFDLRPFLKRCSDAEVLVTLVSQADYDAVDLNQYAAGKAALKLGAISGADMTLEAASTKLMWLLGQGLSLEELKARFLDSTAGER